MTTSSTSSRNPHDTPRWLAATGWTSLGALVLAIVLYGLALAFPDALGEPSDLRRLRQVNKVLALLGLHGGNTRTGELSRDPRALGAARLEIDRLASRFGSTSQVFYLRGIERIAAGDGLAARSALNRARELDPDSSQIDLALGTVHFHNKDFDWAEEAFRRVLTRDPESRAALTNLGQTLHVLGRREEALELYRRLSELEKADEAKDRPAFELAPEPR